jgi:formylglycine-generating enzyme required for sulfatase activity
MSERTKWILGFILFIFIIAMFYFSHLILQGMRGYGVLAQGLEPTQTPDPQLQIGSEYISEKDGMTMVFIPAGDFLLGTNTGQPDEKLEHIVYLDAFWIDKTEVTNSMYSWCVKSGACSSPMKSNSKTRAYYFGNPEFDDYPVIYITWEQAKIYCEWAGRRLPTEAEWEKAARGVKGSKYPWGNTSPDASRLNFAGMVGDTTKVGSYPRGSSPYGVVDMAGNVLEWVADCYGSGYYQISPRQNPTGPSACEHGHRVIRGGTSWEMPSHDWTGATDRMNNLEHESNALLGFRCAHEQHDHDLEKLFVDVFAPQPGDKVLFIVDLPKNRFPDHKFWSDRRVMAKHWHEVFTNLGHDLGFSVHPIFFYTATGGHNGPLPEGGEMEGKEVLLEDMLADTTILVAMTEYSATAPLMEFTEKYPHLRIASMPMVSPAMEQTALAADYSAIAKKVGVLAEKLGNASSARVIFSTGHELLIDLRYREAEVDDGKVHPERIGTKVINLPSGEAYIAPYEGEVEGVPSKTTGTIPLPCGKGFTLITVRENRVVEVSGSQSCVGDIQAFFELDDARRNIAELGLGVNDKAVITGNVLEDEKVWGVHLAAGRSDHIGGVVGVEAFSHPSNVVHKDVVFPFGGKIEVTDLVLIYENGDVEVIIEDGAYTLFDR